MATTQSKRMEEKHLKILRQLTRESGNNRCFDCLEKGPTYVCLDFNTFVCTKCSGIHREMQHRVKSISMATFTPDEIKAIQDGGNDKGRAVWLSGWTPSEFKEPESGDMDSIRQFMNLKYLDKRWFRNPKREKHRKHSHHRKKDDDEKAPVEHISKVLGSDVPKLEVGGSASSDDESEASVAKEKQATPLPSIPAPKRSPSQKQEEPVATPVVEKQKVEPKKQTDDLLDLLSFDAPAEPEPPTAVATQITDLFSQSSAGPAPTSEADQQWATFGSPQRPSGGAQAPGAGAFFVPPSQPTANFRTAAQGVMAAQYFQQPGQQWGGGGAAFGPPQAYAAAQGAGQWNAGAGIMTGQPQPPYMHPGWGHAPAPQTAWGGGAPVQQMSGWPGGFGRGGGGGVPPVPGVGGAVGPNPFDTFGQPSTAATSVATSAATETSTGRGATGNITDAFAGLSWDSAAPAKTPQAAANPFNARQASAPAGPPPAASSPFDMARWGAAEPAAQGPPSRPQGVNDFNPFS